MRVEGSLFCLASREPALQVQIHDPVKALREVMYFIDLSSSYKILGPDVWSEQNEYR